MKNSFKRFFKELKRVKWPKPSEASTTFWKVCIFVFLASLTLFLLAFGLSALWIAWGVGI